MAQLAPIVTLAATGASIYAQTQEAERQKKNARTQQENAAAQQAAQRQVLAVQAAQDTAERQAALERGIASARARLAAGGVNPNDGSAAALTEGLRSTAAAAQASDDATYAARLTAGRRSLLNQDSSILNWARAGQGLGRVARSLLD
ncbi:hypothetical protein [Muricoccus vinaceus]|uniref:Uncharacterized protein n=1 Tax=Muricoccus vinaceus TaxID=424704 RepID=A0ABV6IPV2_9PROT